MKIFLCENLIIRDAFRNISNNLKIFQNLIKEKNLEKEYRDLYSNFFFLHRDYIGDQMWLNNDEYPEYERDLIDRILDLDSDIKDTIKKINNEN